MTQRRRASSHCGCRACPGNPFHHPHEPLRTALWTLGSSPRVTVERWQWTVRNRQTLRERLEGDAGEGVLAAGEGLNLPVQEVADVGAVPEEIGRASCRERVCQYGLDLGGRRIIKKK